MMSAIDTMKQIATLYAEGGKKFVCWVETPDWLVSVRKRGDRFVWQSVDRSQRASDITEAHATKLILAEGPGIVEGVLSRQLATAKA